MQQEQQKSLLPFCQEGPEIGLLHSLPMSPGHLCPCFSAQEQSSPRGQGPRVKVAVTWDKQAWGKFALRSQVPTTLVARDTGGGRGVNVVESR